LSKYSNTFDLLSTKWNVRSEAAYASPQTSCFYICEIFTLLELYKLYQLSYSKYLLLCTVQLNCNDVTLFVITFTHPYNHHIRRVNLINRLASSLVTRIYTRHSFSNIPEGSGDWQFANYVSSFDREDIACLVFYVSCQRYTYVLKWHIPVMLCTTYVFSTLYDPDVGL